MPNTYDFHATPTQRCPTTFMFRAGQLSYYHGVTPTPSVTDSQPQPSAPLIQTQPAMNTPHPNCTSCSPAKHFAHYTYQDSQNTPSAYRRC